MLYVEMAVAVLPVGIRAVFREVLVPVVGHVIERVGIGVSENEVEPVVISRSDCGLQTVVIGKVKVGVIVDEAEIRERGGERPRGRLRTRVRCARGDRGGRPARSYRRLIQ